ncbi:hypothetical protein APA_3412 [Pseudanabaena sp. lw0831]|nr:hypothetical protein APA_3412 [Pseudanabaena sp. lw0831]
MVGAIHELPLPIFLYLSQKAALCAAFCDSRYYAFLILSPSK